MQIARFSLVIAVVLGASAVRADSVPSSAASFVSKLRALPTVVTSQTDARRALGKPQREASAGDGMTVLVYAAGGGGGSNIGDLADLAGLAAWLMPAQMGMATETVSAIAGMGGSAVSQASGSGSTKSDYTIMMLFDREGRLVGWKGTADGQPVRSSDSGVMGFATDAELQQIAQTPTNQPSPASDGKPHLGARVLLVPGGFTVPDTRKQAERTGMCGMLILNLVHGSPAERAGLRLNDLVFIVDGELIASANDLQNVLARTRPGKAVNVLYYRLDSAKKEWVTAQAKMTF